MIGVTGTADIMRCVLLHDSKACIRVSEADPLAGRRTGGLDGRGLSASSRILGELTKRNVKLSFGGSMHNPTDLQEGCCSMCWRWWLSLNSTLSTAREN